MLQIIQMLDVEIIVKGIFQHRLPGLDTNLQIAGHAFPTLAVDGIADRRKSIGFTSVIPQMRDIFSYQFLCHFFSNRLLLSRISIVWSNAV